jgi:osmotically-inducible protein OsmY
MKKVALSLALALSLSGAVGCSNWNRATPASMDSKTIEAEIRKNLAADNITGLTVDVSGGVVTLGGHLSASDRDKAVADAQKVNGVTNVVNNIQVQ